MEIPIGQDIRKYKTKDIGGFSFKEAGIIALGIGGAFIAYKLFDSLYIALVPIAIAALFGFFKPYGMTFLTFLKTVGKETFSPQTYIWETDFVYDFDDDLYTDTHIPESVIQTETVDNSKSIIK